MHGPNGKHVVSMSWDEYSKWQRWEEWPELNNNPPLTVETTFWYKEKEYLVTSLQGDFVIVSQPEFTEVIRNSNFRSLLTMPFDNGMSFKDLIQEFLFED